MRWVGLNAARVRFRREERGDDDRDGAGSARAQITAEWVDTETGEYRAARVAPAHRASVRRFLARFGGQELEVALEATTGWRFVVEELRRVGAVVHLAEPAETSELRGNKKRAKTDRADARQLRELVMTGKLPESWIAPDHILDLRARVRLRHTLVDDRGEWQQRMQAVLYHHGIPQAPRSALTADGRAWLEQLPLPSRGREQITVALEMIDALDLQLAPLDRELRAYARRQPGLQGADGPLRDRRADRRSRSSPSSATSAGSPPRATRSATRAWTSRSHLRQAPRARAPLPPRPARVALGAV